MIKTPTCRVAPWVDVDAHHIRGFPKNVHELFALEGMNCSLFIQKNIYVNYFTEDEVDQLLSALGVPIDLAELWVFIGVHGPNIDW